MANSFNDLYPTIISKMMEKPVRENSVMPRLVALDYSQDFAEAGAYVKATFPGTLSSNVKALATNVTIQNLSPTSVTIGPLVQLEASFKIDDIEKAKARPKYLVENYLEPAIIAHCNTIDGALLGLYADVTANTTGTGGSAIDLSDINAANTKLTTLKAPQKDRFAVLSATSMGDLLNPSTAVNGIVLKINESGSSDALRRASVGPLYGFDDVLTDQNVKTTLVSGVTTQWNMAFNRRAFGLVVRRLEIPESAAMELKTYVTDPLTGLEFRVMVSYVHEALAYVCTVDIVYCVKTLDVNKAMVIKG